MDVISRVVGSYLFFFFEFCYFSRIFRRAFYIVVRFFFLEFGREGNGGFVFSGRGIVFVKFFRVWELRVVVVGFYFVVF